jgi:hypothetical protein
VSAPASPTRARLGRYTVWHLRDYLRDKGIATLVTICLLGILDELSLRGARALGASPAVLGQAVDQAIVGTLRWLSILGAVFATNGIVADDRKRGYYRLLFAKPVSVVEYYAHKFAVYGIGYVIVAVAALGIYNGTVDRFFPAVILPTIAMLFIAFGGIGFLLSAAWRWDWLSLTTVVVLSWALWLLFGHDPGWRGTLVHVLPPVHLVDGIYMAVRRGSALPMKELVWLVGYGLGCFGLGLVVVRRRPLAGN